MTSSGRADPLGPGRHESRAGGEPSRGRDREPLTWRASGSSAGRPGSSRRLTALALADGPFTVVSRYFGMNVEVMPWLTQPWRIVRGPSVRRAGALRSEAETGCGRGAGSTGADAAPGRRGALSRRAPALGLPRPSPALVGDLTEAANREATDAGIASITQEDFAEEWQLRLPGGEDVVVSTPFSRLALAAARGRHEGRVAHGEAAEGADRSGKGASSSSSSRCTGDHPAASPASTSRALLVNGREVRGTFVQNERTPLGRERHAVSPRATCTCSRSRAFRRAAS